MNNYNDEYNILDRVPRLSVPYQIGGTCAYHAVTTVLESRYRVRLMRNARNPDDFPRLACQYLVDFVPKGKNKKKQIFNYTTKVGIISVDDYSAIGMRGENLWIPSSYRVSYLGFLIIFYCCIHICVPLYLFIFIFIVVYICVLISSCSGFVLEEAL